MKKSFSSSYFTRVLLQGHRFFCDDPHCQLKTFEQKNGDVVVRLRFSVDIWPSAYFGLLSGLFQSPDKILGVSHVWHPVNPVFISALTILL